MKNGSMERDPLAFDPDFRGLSVKDLLDARDAYHWHLLSKKNVVGTAIGLYLIRDSEHAKGHGRAARKSPAGSAPREERRFDNSRAHDYSWPCVLVLVKEWTDPDRFGTHDSGASLEDFVPKALYLPDGRVVPVCVVKAPPAEARSAPLARIQWPTSLMGGGLPLVVSAQGRDHVASVGCLVTDGHSTFALTNRHVCGAPGTPVYTELRGQRLPVGRASSLQLARSDFSAAYPEYPGRRTFLNLDVGLVEIDDVNDWTAQVYGIGEIGDLADLNEHNINLHLIDMAVQAHGAASGILKGKIAALFYRYKSVGGFDSTCDFLICPDPESKRIPLPGDSGTVWFTIPHAGELARPIAIQWGGQAFGGPAGGSPLQFALATSLSHVCRMLDIDVVHDHNTGVAPFWGATGHYSIASFACDLVSNAGLKKLVTANLERISFDLAELTPDLIAERTRLAKEEGAFVPLADVPDVVWKQYEKSMRGGRDPSPRSGPEHPTHFADIDEPGDAHGKTLRELSLQDPAEYLTVAFWRSFYTKLGHTHSKERGLLPFRVWQFFDEMVDAAAKKDVPRFVCAAGILSHYVGDACQPLHGSVLADGRKDEQTTEPVHHRDGTVGTKAVWPGQGVHSAYETSMIDRRSSDLLKGIRAELAGDKATKDLKSGHAAAHATVALMDASARLIPPDELVDTYIELGGGKSKAVLDGLWHEFGKKTVQVMANGARTLAMLWESAWAAGQGDKIGAGSLHSIPEHTLQDLYCEPDFVPSVDLDHIEKHLH